MFRIFKKVTDCFFICNKNTQPESPFSVLEKGRIVFGGTGKELMENHKVRETFPGI